MDLFRHGFVTASLADLAAQMHQVAALPDRTVEQVHAKRAAYRRVITQDASRRPGWRARGRRPARGDCNRWCVRR